MPELPAIFPAKERSETMPGNLPESELDAEVRKILNWLIKTQPALAIRLSIWMRTRFQEIYRQGFEDGKKESDNA